MVHQLHSRNQTRQWNMFLPMVVQMGNHGPICWLPEGTSCCQEIASSNWMDPSSMSHGIQNGWAGWAGEVSTSSWVVGLLGQDDSQLSNLPRNAERSSRPSKDCFWTTHHIQVWQSSNLCCRIYLFGFLSWYITKISTRFVFILANHQITSQQMVETYPRNGTTSRRPGTPWSSTEPQGELLGEPEIHGISAAKTENFRWVSTRYSCKIILLIAFNHRKWDGFQP